MTDRRQIRQPGCPEIASPAEITRAKLHHFSFKADNSAKTSRDVLLTIAREINKRYLTELENPEIRYDMEGRPLSVADQEKLRERVAQGLDEPTTMYDAMGRPEFIGSFGEIINKLVESMPQIEVSWE